MKISLNRIDLVEKVLRIGEDRIMGMRAATRDFGYEPEAFNIGLQREIENI